MFTNLVNNNVNKTFNIYLKKIMKQKIINKYFNQNIYFLSPSDYGIHNSLKFKSKVFSLILNMLVLIAQ